MAAQSVLIAETIASMKKALKRRDTSPDSDSSIHQPTNRGNKLKRKAQYVHEGHLDMGNAPRVYRRKIEHAGYSRYIISRNPRRFDEYGDELEDDEVDEEADAAAEEENPYSGVKLENLLAPLTSAAELPSHPSLSTPYLSKVLDEMTQEACEMVQREKASLWRMKQLLTKFRGDETWVPCGNFQTKDDISLFGPMGTGEVDDCGIVHENDLDAPLTSEQSRAEIHATDGSDVDFQESKPEESTTAIILGHGMGIKDANVDAGDTNLPPRNKDIDASGDIVMEAGLETNENLHEDGDEHGKKCEVAESNDTVSKPMKQILDVDPSLMDFSKEAKPNGESDPVAEAPPTMDKDPQEPLSASLPDESGANGHGATRKSTEPVGFKSEEGKWVEGKNREEDGEQSQPAPHRMTTRAQAQAASDNTTSARTRSPSPASSTSTFVHPFFLVPSSAHPDRDFGLPPAEAEDTRRVLMSYVQKQEEVCRGAGKLYEGLLRADRMRKTVLKWCKAEAHVGEMSDGEDWYDKEEWSLDEDLKKGHEEEEDESANQGKKTRGRRA